MAMSVIVLLIALVMPVVYLLDLVPWQGEIIASVFFGIGALAAQLIIVGPKALILLKGLDVGGIDGKLVEQNRPVGGSQIIHLATSAMRQKTKEEKDQKRAVRQEEKQKAEELQMAGLHIKGTYEDKVRIAREQLQKWRVYLMAVEQGSMSGSGSDSGSGSTSGVGQTSLSRQRAGSTSEADDADVEPASFRYRAKAGSMAAVSEIEDTAELASMTKTGTILQDV